MDYLDPKKEAFNNIMLLIGYVLVGVAILIAALVLTYQAKGYGVDKKGNVIQNGLVFFSSKPNPADIYLNDKKSSYQTNTRIVLPSALYDVRLTREGYHDWNKKIDLGGGDVQHYDYPFLFPKTLNTSNTLNFTGNLGLMTQSLDKKWLIIQKPSGIKDLAVVNLEDIEQPMKDITLPDNLLTKPKQSEAWGEAEWADNNRHLVLQHKFDGNIEYILVDRIEPQKSVNLNAKYNLNPNKLTLVDRKHDNYYFYTATGGILQKASLSDQEPKNVLSGVIDYVSYGKDQILYVTADGAKANRVLVKLQVGDSSYIVKSLSANAVYLIDMAKYAGVMYIVIGSNVDGKVYIYKDALGQLGADPNRLPGIEQALRIDQANQVSFSPNAQYVAAESGQNFAVYDMENEITYGYATPFPIDQPQQYASWMDGNRLTYISNGRLVVFDYDGNNAHVLMPSVSHFLPAFDPDYKYVYAAAPLVPAGQSLTQTWLLAPKDR